MLQRLLLVLALLTVTSSASAYGGGSWAGWARRPWMPRDAGSGAVFDLWASNITGVAEDGAVAALADTSGAGNSATGVASPTYKAAVLGTATKPIVRFNGTSQYFTVNGVSSVVSGTDKPFTLVLVYKLRTAGAATFVLAAWTRSSTSTPFFGAVNESSKWETDHRDDASSRTTTARQTSDTSAHIMIWNYTGTACTLQVDGVNGGSDPVSDDKGSITVDRFAIATWLLAGAAGNFAQLDLGRAILFATSLSAADMARILAVEKADYGTP